MTAVVKYFWREIPRVIPCKFYEIEMKYSSTDKKGLMINSHLFQREQVFIEILYTALNTTIDLISHRCIFCFYYSQMANYTFKNNSNVNNARLITELYPTLLERLGKLLQVVRGRQVALLVQLHRAQHIPWIWPRAQVPRTAAGPHLAAEIIAPQPVAQRRRGGKNISRRLVTQSAAAVRAITVGGHDTGLAVAGEAGGVSGRQLLPVWREGCSSGGRAEAAEIVNEAWVVGGRWGVGGEFDGVVLLEDVIPVGFGRWCGLMVVVVRGDGGVGRRVGCP